MAACMYDCIYEIFRHEAKRALIRKECRLSLKFLKKSINILVLYFDPEMYCLKLRIKSGNFCSLLKQCSIWTVKCYYKN